METRGVKVKVSTVGTEVVRKVVHNENEVVGDGAFDIHGRPSLRSKSGNWKACWLIFGCEIYERMAYYAITSNLVTYLTTELHENIADSAKNVNTWAGTTFLTPLLGAFLADTFLGRYWTISVFSCVYFLAMILVTMAVSVPSLKPPRCHTMGSVIVCPQASDLHVGFFYFALYLMALGAGGIKSNVSAYAGDQFDEGDPKESKRKMSFFNWWFISISFGTLLSVTILVYLEDNVGWSWGYGGATVVTGLGTTFFLLGTPIYRNKKPAGSPLTRVAQVIVAAIRKWRVQLPEHDELLYELHSKEAYQAGSRKLLHTSEFLFLDKAATVVENAGLCTYNMNKSQVNPWRLCPVTQVEEVKLLLRVLPIWVTNLIFSTVFAQVGTMFLSQGSTMTRNLGPHFQIPAASFTLFVTLTICLLLPFYDKYFVPVFRKFTGHECGLTLLQRIGLGQLISTISIGVAALVEIKRLKVAKQHNLLDAPQKPIPMTIFWLLPQYVLTGVCEIFISVGQVEFFYDQAPDSMRSIGTALYLSTIAVGRFIGSLLVTIVCNATQNSKQGVWIGNNLNRSHLDYFYWLLTALSSLNLLLYVACARWYTYKIAEPKV